MRILTSIAVAGLLAGCQKSHSYPPTTNLTPVNEGAMPTPDASPPAIEPEATGTAIPPANPPPSPAPATGGSSPGS